MLSIKKEQREWGEVWESLENASIYCSWAYLNGAKELESEADAELAVLEINGARICHPYIRRRIIGQLDYSDLISPFDFGGFWFTTNDPEKRKILLQEFETAFEVYCRREKIVAEFVRIHPFSNLNISDFLKYEAVQVCENIIVDLSAGYDKLWSQFSPPAKMHKFFSLLRKIFHCEIIRKIIRSL